MSHDQDLFDPTEAGGETTRENQDPANVPTGIPSPIYRRMPTARPLSP